MCRHNYAEDVSRPKEEIVTGDGGQQSISASLGTPPSSTKKVEPDTDKHSRQIPRKRITSKTTGTTSAARSRQTPR